MQTVEDINETLDEAQAYARKHPRDRSVRADIKEFLEMRNLAHRTPAHFARRADPQLLANKLDELNDAWQDLMASGAARMHSSACECLPRNFSVQL